jgi:hypothetical protein
MSLTNNLHKLRTLSSSDRSLLFQAVGWLGVMRLAIALLPFRRIAKLLKLRQGESPAASEAAPSQRVERIGWAVRGAAAHVWWKSACFDQALAGAIMLQHRGIAGTVYLGVAKNVDPSTEVAAHAWLRSGEAILTGAAGHERFNVIAAFTTVSPTAPN